MDNFVADLTEKFQPKLFRMRKSCSVWFLVVVGFLVGWLFFWVFFGGGGWGGVVVVFGSFFGVFFFFWCVCVPVEELYHQFLDHKYGM